MATVRQVNDHVDEIKAILRLMVSTRRLRDPLADMHPDLTPPQTHVLAALSLGDPEGMPTSVLAHRICASAPTMTGLVDRMEAQGLVTRERNGDDRRLVTIKLTDAGRKAVLVLDAHVTDRLTGLLSVLEADERETLVRLLTRIIEALPEKG